MASKFVVRKATRQDLPEVILLCKKLASWEGKMLDKKPDLEGVKIRVTHDILFDESSAYFIAIIKEKTVGVIKIKDKENGFAKISEAYVSPNFRNLGIMTNLFNAAALWARERGVKSLYLTVVLGNTVAETFWKRLGFFYEKKCGANLTRFGRTINGLIVI
jgi:GNAT superfamily N-acetyltransferase